MSLFSYSPPIDEARVIAAIGAAERRTSGEIRIVVSPRRADEPLAEAEHQFQRLGMTKTA